jgi:hypothetical protein
LCGTFWGILSPRRSLTKGELGFFTGGKAIKEHHPRLQELLALGYVAEVEFKEPV